MILLSSFVGTLLAVLVYDFLNIREKIENSSKVKELQRAIKVRTPVSFISPSKTRPVKDFINSLPDEHAI